MPISRSVDQSIYRQPVGMAKDLKVLTNNKSQSIGAEADMIGWLNDLSAPKSEPKVAQSAASPTLFGRSWFMFRLSSE